MPIRSFFRAKDTEDVPDHVRPSTTPTTTSEHKRDPSPPPRSNRQSFLNAIKRTVDKFSSTVRSRPTTPATVTSPDAAPTPDPTPSDEPDRSATPTPITTEPPAPKLPRRSRPSTRTPGVRRRNTVTETPHHPSKPLEEFLPPLSDPDKRRLFSGAPQFSLTPAADGELQAKVSYPYGLPEGLEEKDVKDYKNTGHESFDLCFTNSDDHLPGLEMVKEVPNMRSFFGTEPGTSGWEYYLLLPVGDSERSQGEGEVDEEGGEEDGRDRGGGFGDPKGGVRSVEVSFLAERLKELGEIWEARQKRRRGETMDPAPREPTAVELYSHLFTRILFPPTRVTTEDYLDPYSLKVQTTSLVSCLSKRIWLDFSNVGWRIKLGQIIFGSDTPPIPDDATDASYSLSLAAHRETEKVWLLLQLLLSCELLLRLDSLLSDPTTPSTFLPSLRSLGGTKVAWDLLLARRWLENIDIISPPPPSSPTSLDSTSTNTTHWFSSPSSPQSLTPTTPPTAPQISTAHLTPRHSNRQISGLLHFAAQIQWPNLPLLQARLSPQPTTPSKPTLHPRRSRQLLSTTPNPSTPSSATPAKSYFPPILHRKKSTPLTILPPDSSPSPSSATTRGGWLSQTLLSGLLLPGESLPHLLISTLLEQDATAVEKIGFNANLYGGFQYAGSTWWSRHCVLARILAGWAGAGECAGWVGAAVPSGVGMYGRGRVEGWVDVVVDPPPDVGDIAAANPPGVATRSQIDPPPLKSVAFKSSQPTARPNIPPPTSRHRKTSSAPPAARANPTPVSQPVSTFRLINPPSSPTTHIEIRGFKFIPADPAPASLAPSFVSPSTTDLADDDDEFPKYKVDAHFLIGEQEVVLPIRYDVAFISSFPCWNGPHPLHTSYAIRWAEVGDLVIRGMDETVDKTSGVLVVRVSNGEGRVVALTYCAFRGCDAIVGRKGRGCVACAVREASAVGVGVVVWCDY